MWAATPTINRGGVTDAEPRALLAGRRVVDAHVHVFPDRVFDALWRWFERGLWPVKYRLYARDVVRFLVERGVDRVVGLHYSHRPQMARVLNAFVAELATEQPALVPCATVLPGEDGARAILDEALGPLGLRGVKLHCHVQQMAPDDARLDEVYDAAAAHDVPVIIHAGNAPASPHYDVDVDALCTPAALDRALARHPRTTVIVPHLGAERLEDIARLLGDHERFHLDTTMALASYLPLDPIHAGPDHVAAGAFFSRAAEVVRAHADRILYGTDFPNIPYDWDRELGALAGLGLDAAALDAILGGNARRLFRLDDRA